MPKRPEWRQYYHVWCQAEGRDRTEREYAVECRTCTASGTDQRRYKSFAHRAPWITEYAVSRKGAWELAKAHEEQHHDPTKVPA